MNKLFNMVAALLLGVILVGPAGLSAQNRDETLADIRQELTFLHVEIQQLKRELSTTGSFGDTGSNGQTQIERIDALEGELRRVTGKIEQLEFRIEKIVADGTNRIGDLEFRLVELEGGDVSTLGETTTLGGDGILPWTETVDTRPVETGELAVSEQVDYEAAVRSFDNGEYSVAADLFKAFTETYPGGPLTGDAHFWRGESLAALEDWSNAAGSFLESFSSAPQAAIAPKALFRLGVSLNNIGQREDACLILNEVLVRYPGSNSETLSKDEMTALACN